MAEFEAAEEAAEDEGMALPTRQNDEFRPFVRRYELPLKFIIVKYFYFSAIQKIIVSEINNILCNLGCLNSSFGTQQQKPQSSLLCVRSSISSTFLCFGLSLSCISLHYFALQ